MRPNLVPDPLPVLELLSHSLSVLPNIAPKIELSLVGAMGYFYIGILLGGTGVDVVMRQLLLLAGLFKLFQERRAIISLYGLDGELEFGLADF